MDLETISEVSQQIDTSSTQASSELTERQLLDGFSHANIKFHLLSGKLDKLYEKKKFKNLFDIGVLSCHSANVISKELSVLFKDKSKVHVESSDYMVIFKPEQRVEYRKRVQEKAESAQLWTEIKGATSFSHHLLFEINH
ncbi:MAG: DUF4471 domain-containing protein [Candidatus Roizmanbacteria bacterium]